MRFRSPAAFIVLLLLPCFASARKDKNTQNEIIEMRNVALGTTTFTTHKTHVVRGPGKVLAYTLRLSPFVTQNLDGTEQKSGIRIKLYMGFSQLTFTNASLVLMIDGHKVGPTLLDWTVDYNATSETVIIQSGLLQVLAASKEIYLTVLIPGRPTPQDQISFQVSPEQQEDCRLLVERFEGK